MKVEVDVTEVLDKQHSGGVYVLPLMLMYLVFTATRMPGEPSYRRRLRSLLLYLCYVSRALINSLEGVEVLLLS